jgi:hypothetical protein
MAAMGGMGMRHEKSIAKVRHLRREPTLRDQLMTSWRAAREAAGEHGAITMNHASGAGWLLEQYGSPNLALLHCPTAPWWATVMGYLERVVDEEGLRIGPKVIADWKVAR